MIKRMYTFYHDNDTYFLRSFNEVDEFLQQLYWESPTTMVYLVEWEKDHWKEIDGWEVATSGIESEVENLKGFIEYWEEEKEETHADIQNGLTTFEDEKDFLIDAEDHIDQYRKRIAYLRGLSKINAGLREKVITYTDTL